MEMIGESCIYHKAQNFTRVTNYIISSSWGVTICLSLSSVAF